MQYLRHWLEQQDNTAPGDLVGVLDATLTSFSLTMVEVASQWLGAQGIKISTLGNSGRCGWGLTQANADANRATCQVRHTFEVASDHTAANAASTFCCGARISGARTTYNGYFADVEFANNRLAIKRGVGGVDTTLASAVKAMTLVAGDLVHVLFDVSDLTGSPSSVQLRMKCWLNSASEPAAWDVTTVDSGASAIFAAGDIMLGGWRRQTLDNVVSFYSWYASCATAGQNAPARPVTRAEFLDWLRLQDQFRVVLHELSCMAQDSLGAEQTGMLCCSNHDFQAKPYELERPNVSYEGIELECPRFSARLNDALAGVATMSFGDLVVANEIDPTDFGGRLDAWLNFNFDGRNYSQLIGAPDWRRCDFRLNRRGFTQRIYKTGYGRLSFELRGNESLFQLPVHSDNIGGTGPNAGQAAPFSLGGLLNATPVLYDENARVYKAGISSYPVLPAVHGPTPNENLVVRDGGVSLNSAVRTITAGNTGTDVLTVDAAHGFEVGYTWVGTGTMPNTVVAGWKYYVRTVPNLQTFTLSTSDPRASPTPPAVDITAVLTGGTCQGRAYDWDENAGTITPLHDPSGDLTFDLPDDALTISASVTALLVLAAARTANFPTSTEGLRSTGLLGSSTPFGKYCLTWWDRQVTVGQAVTDVLACVMGSLCFSREGFYYLFQLTTPPGTGTWGTITDQDIFNWRHGERSAPWQPQRIGYNKNNTIQTGGALLGSVTPENRSLYGSEFLWEVYAPAPSVALSQPNNHKFAVFPPDDGTLLRDQADAATESQRRYDMRKTPTGTFLFETDAWAMQHNLGDEVFIQQARDGFDAGVWCYVVGISEVASRGWVELEVWAPLPDQFPVVTSTNQIIPETYY
jgi:hypothetical protein